MSASEPKPSCSPSDFHPQGLEAGKTKDGRLHRTLDSTVACCPTRKNCAPNGNILRGLHGPPSPLDTHDTNIVSFMLLIADSGDREIGLFIPAGSKAMYKMCITMVYMVALAISQSAIAQEVRFADDYLKIAVTAALGVKNPTVSDMKKLITLVAINKNISDLSGLEHATNLEGLELDLNKISDISPLSRMKKLRKLWMCDNLLKDISPMAGMRSLERTQLENNALSDISPVSNLTKLKELELDHNNITDISPVSKLKNLELLELENNNINDISPVQGLDKIYLLNIRDNKIKDFSPAASLQSLRFLWIGANNYAGAVQKIKAQRPGIDVR